MITVDKIEELALKAGFTEWGSFPKHHQEKLVRFYRLAEERIERENADVLLVAHMHGYQDGKRDERRRLSQLCAKMPGDTAASFAVWIEAQT